MSSQLSEAFEEIVRIGNTASDPESAWAAMVQFIDRQVPTGTLDRVRNIRIGDDIRSVRQQLESLLASEPPAAELEGAYFGLFDAANSDGEESIGYWIGGVRRYKDEDSFAQCDWLPENRYLTSTALTAIKDAELAASGEARRFLGYVGQIGVALVVSRFASTSLFLRAKRFVGFDSGDVVEMDA